MIWRFPRSFFEMPANCQRWHRQAADLNTADLNIKVGIHVSPPYIKRKGFKSFEHFLDTNKRLMFDGTRIMRSDLLAASTGTMDGRDAFPRANITSWSDDFNAAPIYYIYSV